MGHNVRIAVLGMALIGGLAAVPMLASKPEVHVAVTSYRCAAEQCRATVLAENRGSTAVIVGVRVNVLGAVGFGRRANLDIIGTERRRLELEPGETELHFELDVAGDPVDVRASWWEWKGEDATTRHPLNEGGDATSAGR